MNNEERRKRIKQELAALKKRLEDPKNDPDNYNHFDEITLEIIKLLKNLALINQDYDVAVKLRDIEKITLERQRERWTLQLLKNIQPPEDQIS